MRVIILGGGYAGLSCALRLAGRARGRVSITLVNASEHFVERIRLHQQAVGQRLVVRELRSMLVGTGISLKVGRVTGIDPRGEVLVEGERLPFDRLVVALGSQVDRDTVPGIREHAFTLDSASSAELAAKLPAIAARGGRLAVIGGGLTGIEGASELAESHPGLQVELISAGELGEGLSEEGRAYLRETLEQRGVTLTRGRVRRIQAGAVELEDGTVSFDACVWAGGFVSPQVVRESGMRVNARGQLLVDSLLRVLGHENIYAIGDSAEWVDPPAPLPMGCKSAMPMGVHTGENLARALRGLPEQPFDFLEAAVCISLGRRDGLIQPIQREGTPSRWIITGRGAAWVKELICRSTIWALKGERTGLVRTLWRKTGRSPSLETSKQGTLMA